MPFVVSVHDLLSGGKYQPVIKPKAKSVRAALAENGGRTPVETVNNGESP